MCKTDNGPAFDSFAFDEYMKAKAIKHHRITPEHPQSNTKCERFMRVLGKTLRTADIEGKDWKKELKKLLFNYRNAPHSTKEVKILTSLIQHRTYSFIDLFEQVFQKSVSLCSMISIRKLVRMKRLIFVFLWANQQKMKRNFDAYYKPRESDIQIGDAVLLKQKKQHQLTPRYNPSKFIVTHKNGSAITVRGTNGSIFIRDVSKAKRFNVTQMMNSKIIENPETERKTYPNRKSRTVIRNWG